MKQSLAKEILEYTKQRNRFGVITRLEDNWQLLVDAPDHPEFGAIIAPLWQNGKSAIFTHDSQQYFLHLYSPRLCRRIIGAVHIAQYRYKMARLCDFDVKVIDPRTAWGRTERFIDINVVTCWPDEVLPDHILDFDTALVALTHDPKIDDIALQIALDSDVGYIGALGSRKTHAKRLERLHELGISAQKTSRIHAPVGLAISAKSPAEIACAIIAEIINAYATSSPSMAKRNAD
ncbi:MAG: XdhC family protein [Pseudomonadota bacterium]